MHGPAGQLDQNTAQWNLPVGTQAFTHAHISIRIYIYIRMDMCA